MQNYLNTQQANNPNPQDSNTFPDTSTCNVIGLSILSVPIVLLLGLFAYKKYRKVVLRRQILMLEKIWLLNVKNNTYKQD